MFLHRIHLDPRCQEARRDLADPYQLHATLCRAFSPPETRCKAGEVLWRLEPETGPAGLPRILVQSRGAPNWDRIGVRGWLDSADPPVDVAERLRLRTLEAGERFRFRLRANPCVTRDGKRLGLLRLEDQEAWLIRKGEMHGFVVPLLPSTPAEDSVPPWADVRVTQQQMLRGKQHSGNGIRVFSVLYDGVLRVADPDRFRAALHSGIGHGKALGLGLLSLARIA